MASAEPTNDQFKSMFSRIKFSTNYDMELVTRQGIDSIEEIKTLTQDCVTRLYSIIRNPGGGTNRHVVSKSAENIFQLLVYYFQHQYLVTRDTDHSLVSLVNLRTLCGQCELEKDWDLRITEYVKPVFKYMPKTFEMIKELLSKAKGDSGVPFNYIIRTDLSPADRSDDYLQGRGDDRPCTNFFETGCGR